MYVVAVLLGLAGCEYREAQVEITVVSTPELKCSRQGKLYIEFTSDISEGDDTIRTKKDVKTLVFGQLAHRIYAQNQFPPDSTQRVNGSWKSGKETVFFVSEVPKLKYQQQAEVGF
jgi:hypothetical protein